MQHLLLDPILVAILDLPGSSAPMNNSKISSAEYEDL